MKSFFKEPLFHFLLIGAALFLVFNQFGSTESREDTIIIDDSDVDRMINTWQLQWQRPPTQEELNNIVAQHLHQEVYYREALKMGLDHNDEIVKRRLFQKMEFLMDDIAELDEANEADLKAFYEANKTDYMRSDRLTFISIYFNPDKRDDASADAVNALVQIESGADPSSFGDASFVPSEFTNADDFEITRSMGTVFTDAVMDLEDGSWQGPVPSGYGMHLVKITERLEGGEPDWDDVKGEVGTDYSYDRQERYAESVYESLQKNYRVVFEFEDAERDSIELEIIE